MRLFAPGERGSSQPELFRLLGDLHQYCAQEEKQGEDVQGSAAALWHQTHVVGAVDGSV